MALGHPKRTRVSNPKILAHVRVCPCLACPPGTQVYPTEADHITTRGAGGPDSYENCWPLCTQHHRERHDRGLEHMLLHYPVLRYWLEVAGRKDVLEKHWLTDSV